MIFRVFYTSPLVVWDFCTINIICTYRCHRNHQTNFAVTLFRQCSRITVRVLKNKLPTLQKQTQKMSSRENTSKTASDSTTSRPLPKPNSKWSSITTPVPYSTCFLRMCFGSAQNISCLPAPQFRPEVV